MIIKLTTWFPPKFTIVSRFIESALVSMMSKAVLVLSLGFFLAQYEGNCECTTVAGERWPFPPSPEGTKCVFPFTLWGKTYNGCTTRADPKKKLWCSTETDENGNHKFGKWGYCNDECPSDRKYKMHKHLQFFLL